MAKEEKPVQIVWVRLPLYTAEVLAELLKGDWRPSEQPARQRKLLIKSVDKAIEQYKDPDREMYVDEAIRSLGPKSDIINVDPDAAISRDPEGDHGAWVQAWLWMDNPILDESLPIGAGT